MDKQVYTIKHTSDIPLFYVLQNTLFIFRTFHTHYFFGFNICRIHLSSSQPLPRFLWIQTNKRKSEKISWNSLFLPKYVVGCKITNFKSIKQNYHITQSSSKMPVNAFSQNISNSYSSCTNLVITSVQQHNLMSYENSYKYKF